MGYSKFARGPKKQVFALITAARHWIIRSKKKRGGGRSLVNDIMLQMDEGI